MHIPENYLSPSTCAITTAAMLPVWGCAIKRVREDVPQEKLPLLGVAAAFCFLSMMFNIPLPGGTTGHAVCGTLVAILFGPWAAVIVVSVALAVQAFFFGDGGILAFGANCLNMAFILPMVGYSLYTLLKRHLKGERGELVSAAIASYLALNAAALAAALEFGIQPALFHDAAGNALYCPYPLSVSVPAMLLGHLTVAGFAEAGFTVGILASLRSTAPSFGLTEKNEPSGKTSVAIFSLLAVLIAACPLGLLATGDAWGEWGLEDLSVQVGYTPAGMDGGWEWSALLPDYAVGSLPAWLGYVLSAVIGVSLLVIIFRVAGALAKPRPSFD